MQQKLFRFPAHAAAKPDDGCAAFFGKAYPSWEYLLGQFNELLDLTPEQLGKVQPALDQAGAHFSLIRLEATQKAQAVIGETIKHVWPFLSDGQKRIVHLWQRIAAAGDAGVAKEE